jgi:hypothetical protein
VTTYVPGKPFAVCQLHFNESKNFHPFYYKHKPLSVLRSTTVAWLVLPPSGTADSRLWISLAQRGGVRLLLQTKLLYAIICHLHILMALFKEAGSDGVNLAACSLVFGRMNTSHARL